MFGFHRTTECVPPLVFDKVISGFCPGGCLIPLWFGENRFRNASCVGGVLTSFGLEEIVLGFRPAGCVLPLVFEKTISGFRLRGCLNPLWFGENRLRNASRGCVLTCFLCWRKSSPDFVSGEGGVILRVSMYMVWNML